jgi:hypothetical protein
MDHSRKTLTALLAPPALAAAALLLAPAVTGADTITSKNWAGYAAHRSGVSYRHVSASWRQPAARCASASDTYAAFWVGIGGYRLTAQAMEQIGSELDCRADGSASMSAWYELVPSASHTIRMTIAGGDELRAAVTVSGRRVTLELEDQTRHESFRRTTTVAVVDTSSAEWIAEAPSDCTSGSSCTALPLADFGSVRFADARAQTSGGRSGAISSPLWGETEMLLGYSAHGARLTPTATTATATPTSLRSGGSAFAVSYAAAEISVSGAGSTGAGAPGGRPAGGFGGGPGGGGGAP